MILSTIRPDILVCSETWLDSRTPDSFISSSFPYSCFRKDRGKSVRKKHGGGVLCLIRDHLSVQSISLPCSRPFDILALDIQNPISLDKIRLISVYRPGHISSEENLLFLDTLVDLSCVPHSCIFVGDFNYHIDFSKNEALTAIDKAFLSYCTSLNLRQFVSQPTRGLNILDLVLSSDECVHNVTVVPPIVHSDHSSIRFNIHFTVPESVVHPRLDYCNTDFKAANKLLLSVDWENVLLPFNNISELYEKFSNFVVSVLLKFTPLIFPKPLFLSFPIHIRNLLGTKQRLFKQLSKQDSPELRIKYNSSCAELEKHLCKLGAYRERKYIKSLHKTEFFRYINSRINNKTKKISCFRISQSGALLVTDNDKALALSEQFSNVFTVDNGLLPPLFSNERSQSQQLFPVITPELVLPLLSKLKKSTACSFDCIPQLFFKKCCAGLAYPLCHIYNLSICSSTVPDAWKQSFVTPIPKISSPKLASDFRPISITSPACKVMEKIICDWIHSWLAKENLLPSEQHGFVKGRSVETQLLECQHLWFEAIDSGKCIDIIYYDFAKAFDKVSHPKLLFKLSSLGLPSIILDWLHSFLSARTFSVKVGNATSDPAPVISGVPQGSVLGPLLFIIYVSELPTLLKTGNNIEVRCFADDLKVFSVYKPEESANSYRNLQSSIDRLGIWCDDWQLEIAHHKCNVVYMGKGNPQLPYSIDNTPIDMSCSVRDLGVRIQNNLQFVDQIANVYSGSLGKLFLLLKCVKSRDASVLLLCYKTWVLPKLEFASCVWSPHKQKDIKRLERVQATFTRIVYHKCFSQNYDSFTMPQYAERLKELGLVSLQERRVRKDLVMAFRILKGELRVASSRFFGHKPNRARVSIYNFRLPLCKTQHFTNSFFNRTAKWIMKLPKPLQSLPNSISFKNALEKIDVISLFGLTRV